MAYGYGFQNPTLNLPALVSYSKVEYNKHCKLQFGTYVQVH